MEHKQEKGKIIAPKYPCAGCRGDYSDDPKNTISCKVKNCAKVYHNSCINADKLTPEQIKSWVCPDCKASTKKGGDNSSTPVRSTAAPDAARGQAPSDNVTVRNKKGQQAAPHAHINSSPEISALTSEIKLLRSDVSTIQSQITAVLQTLVQYTDRLDVVSNKIEATEVRLKLVEEQQLHNASLQETVDRLQFQLNAQEQTLLRNDVEIVGCPESLNENPVHLALTTAAKVGYALSEADIDGAWRTGPRVIPAGNGNSRAHACPIAIRFTRRASRDAFLKAAKSRRNVTSADLVDHVVAPVKIYVNERLSRSNRHLFRVTRQRATVAKFKRCWTSHGSVYVRRHDGSPAIHVRNLDDLDRVFGDCDPAAGPGRAGAAITNGDKL
ncbi:hypothetical protein MSG28_015571 [Choristoneura fumiferana]|uniref:Uncharacterized protein n=1 Tax=Choristoneura fumiferana TaxID=7141 RepID=A0ACC0KBK8_CHOFU|nr:hypothetical protein MSG28_015571 [Choristoneura fumiferana]